MAITIFYQEYTDGAQEEFREWMATHPEHFYLNKRGTRDYMAHSAKCPHLADETEIALTRYRKLCAPTTKELWAIASDDGGAVPAICLDCARMWALRAPDA